MSLLKTSSIGELRCAGVKHKEVTQVTGLLHSCAKKKVFSQLQCSRKCWVAVCLEWKGTRVTQGSVHSVQSLHKLLRERGSTIGRSNAASVLHAPRMCGCKPQVQTTIHAPCSCLRVCEYHTFQPSQQTLRHSRAATENFKRHRVRKLQVHYGAMDSLLLKLQRQHDLQMRDLRTGQPRDKRFFRGVSLGHLW